MKHYTQRRRLRSLEQLEARHVLSGISFLSHSIDAASAQRSEISVPADIDNDGDVDVVVYGFHGFLGPHGGLGWYEYSGSSFAARRIIDPEPDANGGAVTTGDLDNDGDADIVVTRWLPDATPAKSEVMWYENLGAGDFERQQVLGTIVDEQGLTKVEVADIDSDADPDIVVSGSQTHLLRNVGDLQFAAELVAGPQAGATRPLPGAFRLGDLDSDGDLDFLIANDSGLAIVRTLDDGFQRVRIADLPAAARDISIADVDGDQDLDVLVHYWEDGVGTATWIENSDGAFDTSHSVYSSDGSYGVQAADIDGDGDQDVISSRATYVNNGTGGFSVGNSNNIPNSLLFAVDVDGDGDLDLVPDRSLDLFLWHENVDGNGQFQPQIVASGRFAPAYVHAADFNGDKLLDILTTSHAHEAEWISWYANEGAGRYGTQQLIGNPVGKMIGYNTSLLPQSARGADMDLDGDMDIVAAGRWHQGAESFGAVVWYANVDGLGTFSAPRIIARFDDSRPLVLAISGDVDGDQDIDVVVGKGGGLSDDEVYLVRQIDNNQTFGEPEFVDTVRDLDPRTFQGDSPLYLRDVDEDGDLDLLGQRDLWIYAEESAEFRKASMGQRGNAVTAFPSNHVADFDGDGEFDFAEDDSGRTTVWLTNDNTEISVSKRDDFFSALVHVADLDNDGDADLVVTNGQIIQWHENRWTGDADDDGEVSFGDFLILSSNFGKEIDAFWEHGDFDADGEVSFTDFLLLSASFGSTRH